MLINPMAADTAFLIDRRRIYYAIVVSVCVHLIAYQFLAQLQGGLPILSTKKVHPIFRLRIAIDSKPHKNTLKNQVLNELSISSNRKTSQPTALPSEKPKTGTLPRKLDISRDTLKAAIRDLSNEPDPPKVRSENGATVMDAELLKLLNRATRRQGVVADDLISEFGSSFSGGTWTDFVKLGDKCFRVVRSNPLDPVPREMWYGVKCSG